MEIRWCKMRNLEPETKQELERRMDVLSQRTGQDLEVSISGKSSGHHRLGGKEVHIKGHVNGTNIVASRIRPDLSQAAHDAMDIFESSVHKIRNRTHQRHRHRAA